jgi:hypothetical protein
MNSTKSALLAATILCSCFFACGDDEADGVDNSSHCIPAVWQGECYEGEGATSCDGEVAPGSCPSSMVADGGVSTKAVARCAIGGLSTVYYRMVDGASESDLNDALAQIQQVCEAAGGSYEKL